MVCSRLLLKLVSLNTPKLVLFPFIMTTIIYWMSDILADGSVYIQVVLIFILNVQVAISLSTFVSALTGTVDRALAIIIPVILPLLIFSGFFLNNNSIPDYFIVLDSILEFKKVLEYS